MKRAGIVLIVLNIVVGCSQETSIDRYNNLVKKELAANKRVDSIFFGIHLGMVRKAFFMHCWEMNKKGIFSDGTGNMYVLYKLDKELKYPATMNFYPDFNDSTIWRMRVNFQYKGWAPWNKYLDADNLLPDVLALYKKWYNDGNEFIQLNDQEKGIKYVKIDGNRKITIMKSDEVIVKAEYTDMLAEKHIKNIDEN